MKKDVLTTIGGLVLVGLVVVATFLYGNQQRQNQAKHDQDIKKQQETKAPTNPQTSGPQASTSAPQQPAVQKPQADSSNLQGGKTGAPSATPTPASKPAPVAGVTQTPKTGGEVLVLIPVTAMLMLYRTQRRSRMALRRAALGV